MTTIGRGGWVVLCVLSLAACGGPPRRTPTVGKAAPAGARAAASESRAVASLKKAEVYLDHDACALAAARLSFAWGYLEDESGPVARDIQRTWGDVEMARRRYDDAAERYQRALSTKNPSQAAQDDLCYRVSLALREAGDAGGAATWKSRVRRPSASALASLERELLDRRPTPKADSFLASSPGGIPDDPKAILGSIRRRSEWGAAPSGANWDAMDPITVLTVHHSACCADGGSPSEALSALRGIQSDHIGNRGYADIGYHFLIDQGGAIWEGRPLKMQGAHAGNDRARGVNHNIGNLGVCLLGNFEAELLGSSQRDALTRMLDACRKHFRLPVSAVKTHQEVYPDHTECPGSSLQDFVESYRAAGAASVARQ